MRYIFITACIFIFQLAFSQVKELRPTAIKPLDFNAADERMFNRIVGKYAQEDGDKTVTAEEKAFIAKIGEDKENYWDVLGIGCSWYCGGPKEVTASSYLKQQGATDYVPENAHDLNYKNVWAEGVSGYRIGEYLLYTFSGSSPRITEIIVVNGHVKSQTSWEENSRVKTLKVYINNKPYAVLHLEDVRASQHFNLDKPIGNSNRKNWEQLEAMPDWTIKFEILDVYKGLKYDDTVLSEIYFDGIDVH